MDERIFLKVRRYIERYGMIEPGDTVVAGVSGGADSVCLLLLLCETAKAVPFRLLVAHVNHGIREESGADADYVRKLCGERKLPFFLIEEDVRALAQRDKLSEEEAGRKARYGAFNRILKEQTPEGGRGKIAVAHNAGDRVETMLFHLFRGTGLAGASGIKPVRGNVIRPLLCLSREEIEAYLKEKEVAFCIDRTNLEDTYTRNRIRNHLIPFAENEICKGAAAHMWETADLLLETEEYIKKQALRAYEECLTEKAADRIVLDIFRLEKQEELIKKQIFLHCLEELTGNRKDITSVHVEAIRKLTGGQGSRQISLPYGVIAAKEYGRLLLYKQEGKEKRSGPEEKCEALPVPVPGILRVPGLGEAEFSLFPYKKTQIIPEKSYTKWFDYDRITRSLVFRTRETGDYLTINENLSRKTIKDYMIGEKIPKNKRREFYLLADGSHILWVPGHRISQYYKVTEDTKNILQVQLRGGL